MSIDYHKDEIYLEESPRIGTKAMEDIRHAIASNHAVGTIVGYYDEPLSILSVSGYLLDSLEYDIDGFNNTAQGSLKNVCCGRSCNWMETEIFRKIQGNLDGELLTGDGTPVVVHLYKMDSVDTKGNPIWILAACVDWEYENYMLINEAIQSGPWYMDCDSDGNITAVNWSDTFRKMIGYHDTLDFPNVLESWSELLHPEDHDRIVSRLYKAIADRSNQTKYNVEYRLKVADGTYCWFRAIGEIIRRRDGSARRIAGVFINIDREKEVAGRLERADAFHMAFTQANLCEYYVDLAKNTFESLKVEPSLLTIFEQSETWDELIQALVDHYVCEEDKKEVTDFYDRKRIAEKLNEKRSELSLECQVEINGEIRWLRNVVMRGEQEQSPYVMIFLRDITQAKREELEARNALKDAFLAAERANKAKTEFLTNMSHDIRTPMNAIVGLTALAGANIENQERVAGCLSKITKSSRHLLRLINEVLDMARIESGKIALTEEEFALSDLVDNMIHMITPHMDEHHHHFTVDIQHIEHEAVCGDSMRIQQLITNLMNNAVKYTPDGGNIRLAITEKPNGFSKLGCFEFCIEDDGIGMTEEFQNIMFQPFTRADDRRTTNVQGTGLGMAIAQNIVNMMNGEIKVESQINQGTKVTITIYLKLQDKKLDKVTELINLPVLVVDDEVSCCESTVAALDEIGIAGEWVTSGEEAVKLTLERHEKKEDYFAILMDWMMPGMNGLETTREIRKTVGSDVTIIVLTAYDYSEIEAEARAAGVDAFIAKPLFPSRLTATLKRLAAGQMAEPATEKELAAIAEADYSGKRVLLVEDNELNREIATEIIRMTNVEVECAVNGKEAVEKVALSPEDRYDLILMDIQMPVMNGYEATAAIRSFQGRRGRIPIVATTANAFAEDVQLAKNTGMNGHIAKPLELAKLRDVLKEWLEDR